MSKKTFILLLAGLCQQLAFAQKASIYGTVTDAATGEPLIAATVRAGTQGTVTDIDGSYSLELDAGTHTIAFRYVGYQLLNQEVELAAGGSAELNAELEQEAAVLQTATVTSGKFQKPLSEVTVSLEVLRPGLIQSTGKTSMDEALEKVPGVTIIDGQANIRGGSGFAQGAGSRVLLLVDDMPILSADAGFPNWNDVPIENIAQVEVVKGAASALYGSSALNGIINVRTAYPKAKPETEAAVFYTRYMAPKNEQLKWWDSAPYTVGASLAHRRKIGKLDLVVGGYYLDDQDYYQDVYNRYGRFNFNTRYRASDRLTIGLSGNFNAGESSSFLYWKSDTAAYIPNPATLARRERVRYNIDPLLNYYDGAGNRHRLQGRFYSTNNDNDANQANASNLYYGEYQFQRQISEAEVVLTAGGVISGSSIEAELYGDTTFTSRNIAGYVQADKKIGGRLNLTAGFRYEGNLLDNPGFIYNEQKDTVPPSEERESKPVLRLGLNYKAAQATYLRASWGQGYRYPTIAEKYIVTNAGFLQILPNPALGSETGWSAELGVKQGFRVSGFEGFIDLAGFVSRYQDMIEFNFTTRGFQAINIGETSIKGLEVTVAGRGKVLGVPLSLLSGYTLIDPRFDQFDPNAAEGSQALFNAQSSSSEENILKYRSRHLLKFDLEAELKGLVAGVELFHNSQVEAVDQLLTFIAGVRSFRENHPNGFTVLNFRAGYHFTDFMKFTLLLNNSLNTEYTLRPALMEAPRNLTARLDFKF